MIDINVRVNALSKVLENIEKKINDIEINPINIKVDYSQLDTTLIKLREVHSLAKDIKINIKTNEQNGSGNKGKSKSSSFDSNSGKLQDLDKTTKKVLASQNAVLSLKNTLESLRRKNSFDIINTSKLDKAIRDIKNAENEIFNARNKLDKLTINPDLIDDKALLELDKVSDGINQTIGKIKVLKSQLDSPLNIGDYNQALIQNQDKLGNRLNEYFNKHRSGIESSNELFSQYQTLMRNLNSGTYKTIKQANLAFAEFRMECRKSGIEVQTFGSLFKNTFGSRIRSAMAGQGVYMIQRSVEEILQATIEVNTAMTELKKVTNETDTTYDNFLTDASKRARELGASLTEVIGSTADFARLGYNIAEATKLADATLLYTNIGDGVEDQAQASESIISTMQGFQLAAEDAGSIVDKFNEVGNNFATSSGDIGEGLKRSSAALAAAGNDLDQSIALFTGAQEITQDADVVGTALKTISMRLRSTKTDAEAAGEDTDGMATSVSKLRDEVLALSGVDIQLSPDTYKDTYTILQEMSKVWGGLTDMTRANLLELFFGKRQTTTCLDVWRHAS